METESGLISVYESRLHLDAHKPNFTVSCGS